MSTTTIEHPAAERLLTAEEFRAMPDDGRRTELVRGRVVEVPPTNFLHGIICSQIIGILREFVLPRQLGRVLSNDSGVITRRDPDSVRGPDVSYFSFQRVPKDAIPDGYPEVAPELLFEVKSPSDRWKAIMSKVAEYLNAGTIAVCVVDPETREITVYTDAASPITKSIEDELTMPDVLPDFRVPVRQFFE